MTFEFAINLCNEDSGFICPVALDNGKYYTIESLNHKILRFVELTDQSLSKHGEVIKAQTSVETEVGKRDFYAFLYKNQVYLYKINDMAKYLKDLKKNEQKLSDYANEEIKSFFSEYRAYIRKKKAKLEKKKQEQGFDFN